MAYTGLMTDLTAASVVAFTGRQSNISLAELESVLGPESILATGADYCLLDTQPPGDSMGGLISTADIVATTNKTSWNELKGDLTQYIVGYASSLETSKLTLGISLHGIKASKNDLKQYSSMLKESVSSVGKSLRCIQGNGASLSSAQVLHNKLFKPNKIELSLVLHEGQTLLCKTTWVQDIESYARRDQNRPMRDATVGMLPPKLAQILINLACKGASQGLLLDPFCGTGVLLQEAMIMGYNVIGTDLEPRMIEYTRANLEWIKQRKQLATDFGLEVGDAQSLIWAQRPDLVACETYLGPPLSKKPTIEEALDISRPIDDLHASFFANLAAQLAGGTVCAVAVPCWITRSGDKVHLPCLDSLEKLGYNRLDFASTSSEGLIYHRPDQVVARQIIVIEKV